MFFHNLNYVQEMVKRDVIIVDKSAHEVSLTLWGNTARNFDGEDILKINKIY